MSDPISTGQTGTDPTSTEDIRAYDRRRTRRGFLTWGAGVAGTTAGFQWLRNSADNDAIPWLLRNGLEASAKLQRTVLGSSATVATHNANETTGLRTNGDVGLGKMAAIPREQWPIELWRDDKRLGTLTLDRVLAMKSKTITVDHKCIEGWSEIVSWTGVPMGEVLTALESIIGKNYAHVGFATPDREYQITLDRAGAHHRQTMMALQLDGKDLTPDHGAPVRLAVPTRYGIKSLKRIGVITVSEKRQPDYWAQEGYDYDASF